MTRINTNIHSMNAISALNKSNKKLGQSLERLSTGFRINRAADDPAGLVISERLRSQVAGMKQAVDNSERALNMFATAESALVEVNSLLLSVQDLVIEAANAGAISTEEIEANQAQIDDALASIDRIANTTAFAGKDLLNGNLAYLTSGLNSGVTNGSVAVVEHQIFGAAIRGSTSSIQVNIKVTQNASQAVVSTSNEVGISGAQLLIRGNKGSELITFNTSQAQSAVVAAVNAVTDNTGVTARLSGGANYVVFTSEFFGKDQIVQVQDVRTNAPSSQYIDAFDEGANIVGTVNGIKADGDGLKLSIRSFEVSGEFTFSNAYYAMNAADTGSTGTSSVTHTFYISGGGNRFQLGQGTRPSEQAFVAIDGIGTFNLGSNEAGGFLSDVKTGGKADLKTDPEKAHDIIAAAIDDVTKLRARLGAFQSNTLETNINSLNVAIENLAASESRIRDTDFATETAEFTRAQITVQAGIAVLAQANFIPQAVLGLLA
jgi:flagellin